MIGNTSNSLSDDFPGNFEPIEVMCWRGLVGVTEKAGFNDTPTEYS